MAYKIIIIIIAIIVLILTIITFLPTIGRNLIMELFSVGRESDYDVEQRRFIDETNAYINKTNPLIKTYKLPKILHHTKGKTYGKHDY